MGDSSVTAKITNRHRRLMDALVRDGLTPREVSLAFGITEGRLSTLRRSPLWKEEEERMRKEHLASYHGKIASLLPKAITALEETVVEKREIEVVGEGGVVDVKAIYNSPKDRLAAAKEILSRSGLIEGFRLELTAQPGAEGMYSTLKEIQARKRALMSDLGIAEVTEAEIIEDKEERVNGNA